jgi:hypothetical protein
MKDFKIERFKSVYEFEDALNKRPVNKAFRNLSSHRSGDSDWFQTKDYEEAEKFLKEGWNAKIEELKTTIEKYSRLIVAQHKKQVKDVRGFVPCVPRALKGHPKAMISYARQERTEKRNTIHVVFNNCGTGGVSGDTLLKCGLTVLKMALVLDKSNIRTKIDVVPKMSYVYCGGNSCYGCTVTIKDYRQPFNFSKMAYPIANPSFFRRHGFAYLEHMDGDMRDWSFGYGTSLAQCPSKDKEEYLEWAGLTEKNGVVYVDIDDCRTAGFDPEKLMKNKGINLRG